MLTVVRGGALVSSQNPVVNLNGNHLGIPAAASIAHRDTSISIRRSPSIRVTGSTMTRLMRSLPSSPPSQPSARPAVMIEWGPSFEREVVDEQRRQILDVRWTRRQIDEVLHAGRRVGHTQCAGGVGRGRGNAAKCRAGPDRDGGGGVAADLARNADRRLSADRAIGAVGAGRNGALHHRDVAAGPLLDRFIPVFLGLAPRCRHDRLVVVHRQQVENHFGCRRAAGSQEGFGVPRAVLEFQPDQHRFLRLLNGRGNLRRHGIRQRECRRHRGAESHELASRHAAPLELGGEPSMFIPSRWSPRSFSCFMGRLPTSPTRIMQSLGNGAAPPNGTSLLPSCVRRKEWGKTRARGCQRGADRRDRVPQRGHKSGDAWPH